MREAGLEPKIIHSSGDIGVNEVFFNKMLDESVPDVALVVKHEE